eukprot:GHVS01085953.1.p1 GENE.GHVS01085953.1~~GHVS01085953.1.p1  ORF type:complete len:533 (+),score=56.61 GHVS01085953.1:39-1637(+)
MHPSEYTEAQALLGTGELLELLKWLFVAAGCGLSLCLSSFGEKHPFVCLQGFLRADKSEVPMQEGSTVCMDEGGEKTGGNRRGATGGKGEMERGEEGGEVDRLVKLDHKKEAERKRGSEGTVASNRSSSLTGWVCMALWFMLNIVMTIYGKALFSIYRFPYPLLLTAIHMGSTSIGVFVLELVGVHTPRRISWHTFHRLLWFSLLFSANIWLSNASLMAVSIGLHQVVRTTIPLFTMVISLLFFREIYPLRVLPSVLLVIAGVGFTMKGDLDFAVGPFILVILGCFFSSLKGILTQKTQVGSAGLSALDLLKYLCPLATVQMLVVAWSMGEVDRCREAGGIQGGLWLHLPLMGLVAFLLNLVSFKSAALLNPLTLNIAGNVKQVATSLLSLYIFGGVLSVELFVGILSTAVGALWYSTEMRSWKKALHLPSHLTPQSKLHDYIPTPPEPSSPFAPDNVSLPSPLFRSSTSAPLYHPATSHFSSSPAAAACQRYGPSSLQMSQVLDNPPFQYLAAHNGCIPSRSAFGPNKLHQ